MCTGSCILAPHKWKTESQVLFKIPNTTRITKQLCNLTLVISVTEKWKGCVSLTPKDYGDLVSLD